MKTVVRVVVLLAALTATGCASVKPSIRCTLDGKAEVFQGFMGIGVGQSLPEIDARCAALVAK